MPRPAEPPLAAELRRAIRAEQPNLLRLAQSSGVSRGTLYHLTRGTHRVREETLHRIAAGLATLRAPDDVADSPSAAVERLASELVYANAFDRRSARARAREVASGMLARVTAIKDLPYVHEQVAENLRSTVRGATGDAATAAQLGLARVALESGDYAQTLRLTAAIAQTDRQTRAVARWIESEALRMLGRWSEARAAAGDALRARDPVVRAWAHWNRGKLDDKAGRYAAAAVAYRRAIVIAGTRGIPQWEARDITAWSLWALAWVAVHTGTSEEALTRLREASAAAPTGDAGVHLWIAHGLAHVLMVLGELDEARDILTAAIELAQALSNHHYTAWMHKGLAEIALVQGAYEAAAQWAARAAEVYAAHAGADAPSRAVALAIEQFARSALRERSWGLTAVELEELAQRTAGYVLAQCAVRLLACEAHRLHGDLDRAAREAAAVAQLAKGNALAVEWAHAQLAIATIALQRAATDPPDPRQRILGLAALRRARRRYETRQAAWGIARCLMLAPSAGLPADEHRLRDLVRRRYPLEAAEVGLLRRAVLPQTPLAFPGN